MISDIKNIKPRNEKGQRHGYHEIYYKGDLHYLCTFNDGFRVGYEEYHYITDKGAMRKRFIIR